MGKFDDIDGEVLSNCTCVVVVSNWSSGLS